MGSELIITTPDRISSDVNLSRAALVGGSLGGADCFLSLHDPAGISGKARPVSNTG